MLVQFENPAGKGRNQNFDAKGHLRAVFVNLRQVETGLVSKDF